MKWNCAKCRDTGVWDTGNNDLPCDCPAGATAEFNVATASGLRTLTGAELRDAERLQPDKESVERIVRYFALVPGLVPGVREIREVVYEGWSHDTFAIVAVGKGAIMVGSLSLTGLENALIARGGRLTLADLGSASDAHMQAIQLPIEAARNLLRAIVPTLGIVDAVGGIEGQPR